MNELGVSRLRSLERREKLTAPKKKCRVCLEALPRRRRGFCTDECRDAYLLAVSAEFARAKVYARDAGWCAGCSLDCDALERRTWGYSTMARRPRSSRDRLALMLPYDERAAKCRELARFGFVGLKPGKPVSLWHADHIEPLADAGSFGLDNLQTLCRACHAKKTAEESMLRAKRRKLVGVKQTETMRRFRKAGILKFRAEPEGA